MKTKIGLFLLLSLVALPSLIKAQEYKIAVENPTEAKLSLAGFSGDMAIEGTAGSEIIISSSHAEDLKIPDRAKGLKPVYSGGTDNTGIGLSVDKEGTDIKVNCLLPFTKNGDYTLKVPESLALAIKSECQNQNRVTIRGMKGEIEVKSCTDITLKDVSGPLVLSTISGSINISFANIASGKPFSINSVSGDIDITLPSKFPADMTMSTVTGNMYSDFDFGAQSKDIKQIGGNQLNYKLNGGGTKFNIVTVSGNIYLRKGN